jgi:predicted dehydrogenase
VRATTRLDRVLDDPGVDAVVIATPVHTHYEMAARVLSAGRHAFVDKPLAPSSELADDLAQMASAGDRILMCGHTFVYSPAVRAVKRMLAARSLGEIYFISSSWVNLGLEQRGVSVIWDLGPHDFSILLYWLSEMPTSARALGRDSIVTGIPDVAFVTLSFASGIVANIELSRLAPSRLRRTVLMGSKRMVVYDDSAAEPVQLFHQGSDDVSYPRMETHEPLGLELSDFVNAVRTNDRMEWHTTLARSVVRIVEAADRSLASGGDEVAVDHAGLAPQPRTRPALALA